MTRVFTRAARARAEAYEIIAAFELAARHQAAATIERCGTAFDMTAF